MRTTRLIGAIGLAAAVMATALSFRPRPTPSHAQSQPPAGRVSQCTGTISSTVSASSIRICDPLTVTVNVAPECPVCPGGINAVYIQMERSIWTDWMVSEAQGSFDELVQWTKRAKIQVGVVHYGDFAATMATDLTDPLSKARAALGQPHPGAVVRGEVIGATRTALKMLRDARETGGDGGADPCEFIIFFALTKANVEGQGERMLQAARMIHSEGIELFVGCPDPSGDRCIFSEQMPKGRDHYTANPEHGKLLRMVAGKVSDLIDRGLTISDILLTQVLPSGLAYVEGSASIPPTGRTTALDNHTTLSWDWKRIRSTAPHTLTYRAEALAEGPWNIEGSALIVDSKNRQRSLPMASRPITVTGLCSPPPTETPTEAPPPTHTPADTPTPKPTPTATSTATATNTPMPTATPTPKPGPLYLPVLLHEKCTVDWVYSDVALVVDLSTSMNDTIGGGRTKLDATLDAAKQFLSVLDLTPDSEDRSDRVAIVGFNHRAWLAASLTRDAADLQRAIDDLPSRQAAGTRLDLGFEQSLAALQPALGTPNTTPVIILLTDGLPSQVPLDPIDGTMETTVRKAARQAKDVGVRVYTIGIGLPGEFNGILLRDCATSPAGYFYTPDPEALAGIYAQIAYAFGCPRGRHDWGQPWP